MARNSYPLVYPNPTPPGVRLFKNVPVEMRDGVILKADIYRPATGKGPWPVILAYSSFPKERFFESAKPGFYCPRGYVCVQVAERGIAQNQGQFTFQGPLAARDGYDLVEWLADQPWCTGKVAMMGASGYGVMQWITAPLNPPHLKALVVLGTTDNYRGLCYPGGVLRKPFVLNLVSGLVQGALWPGPVQGKQPPLDIVAGILGHNEDGPFWWEHGGDARQISRIKVPILNLVQAPNRLHAPAQLRSYADIRSPKKLWITPWTNENYQPWIFETEAFNQQVLRWLDYWLKGEQNGIMDEPEVAIYDNGSGRWRYENEYPLKRTRWSEFFLQAAGRSDGGAGLITRKAPRKNARGHFYYNISLNLAALASYGANIESNQSVNGRPRHLIFVSEPLEADLTLCGPASLTLYASTEEENTSDWSFFVKLGEMVPGGIPLNPVTGKAEMKPEISDPWVPKQVQIWSWGSLKTRLGAVNQRKSREGMPWHDFRRPQELKPNIPYKFEIELQPIFKTFKAGSRLWLKISSDDALYSTRDCSSRYVETPLVPEKNKITLYLDAERPSRLVLPVIPEAAEIRPVESPLKDALPGAPRFLQYNRLP
jgi:predicted acyl esterase